ncbi:hypothetical protein [Brevundimonas aurantiaca]|uniref:hypothetical protein n=1 Tax=Brevundimonas aurantiaca TaxID=74316 RepID=UPI00174BE02B|nr:hypothetical protein [Brevundimonas aurantiaca]
MASLHGISLVNFARGDAARSVALALSEAPIRSRLLEFTSVGWEVEVRAGSGFLVARTNRPVADDVLLGAGIDAAQKALDLISLLDGVALVVQSPESQHFTFHRRSPGAGSVSYRSSVDVPVNMSVEHTIIHADGREERPAPPPVPDWNVAYRFYRLSQSSRDMYEAYRNLFLGLEALFDHLFPKGRREGEKDWLIRAVAEAGSRIDLAALASGGATDHARDIVARIYGVRVKLFHAKTGRAIIPQDRDGYLEVSATYPLLLALWSETVRFWLSPGRGGGVVTYAGFKFMVQNGYATARLAINADLPPSETLRERNLDLAWTPAPGPVAIEETGPGQMTIKDTFPAGLLAPHQQIGHVGILGEDGLPMVAGTIPGGLQLEGCGFDLAITLRLRNSGSPRTEFG